MDSPVLYSLESGGAWNYGFWVMICIHVNEKHFGALMHEIVCNAWGTKSVYAGGSLCHKVCVYHLFWSCKRDKLYWGVW